MWLNPPVCISCHKAALEAKKRDTGLADWFLREEVKDICLPCYESMVANNISRIKKSVLLDKINKANLMKFREIIYIGEGTYFNIGGLSLKPKEPIYFTEEELPLPIDELLKLKDLKVSLVELDHKPNYIDVAIKKAELNGSHAVMWIGPSPRRTNEFGTFPKNEPVFCTAACWEYCKTNDGFKVLK